MQKPLKIEFYFRGLDEESFPGVFVFTSFRGDFFLRRSKFSSKLNPTLIINRYFVINKGASTMYSRKRSETRSDYKASDLLFTPPRTSLLTINQERQSKQKSDSSSHQPASSSIRTPNDAPPVTSLRNNVSFQYSQTPNNRATPARKVRLS